MSTNQDQQGAGSNPYAAPPVHNPYAAPAANVDVAPEGMGGLIEGGRRVDASRGLAWLSEGFSIFMQAPGAWLGITVVFVLLTLGAVIVPLIGQLAMNLLMPVFSAGMLLGCRALEEGEELRLEYLFAGFNQNVGRLVMVGLLYMAGLTLLTVGALVLIALGVGAVFATGANKESAVMIGGIAIVVLLVIALLVPLAMAVWYAPALVVFHDQEPMAAMKQSFAGCMKNLLPFLLYGILLFVLCIVATLPLMLGWLVLGPVMIGGLYVSYRDIFCA